MKIAFYGSRGAYSEAAAAAIFDEDIATYPHTSFAPLFDALDSGKVDLAVVPYNSSRVGNIPEILHLLRERNVCVNYHIRISTAFVLAGMRDAQESDVKEIIADPLALLYCSQYVQSRKDVKLTPTFRMEEEVLTALPAKNDKQLATLCGPYAATIFGFKTLKPNCNDDSKAFMVYLGLGKEPRVPDKKELAKGKPVTMVVIDLADEPGALMHSLEAFATEEINLISMELKPTDRKQGRVSFFVTFEGMHEDENVKAVIRKLESVTAYVHCLGSYVPRIVAD
ncbi:MAG: hypothetical protein HUU29_06535 [Planctomycetaceae bacterium]|nr:hypothetical protein [Planctomycetaceae bacterium]